MYGGDKQTSSTERRGQDEQGNPTATACNINKQKTLSVATSCQSLLPSSKDTARETITDLSLGTRTPARHQLAIQTYRRRHRQQRSIAMLWKCPNCVTANLSERCLLCGTPRPPPPPARLSPWQRLVSTCRRGWGRAIREHRASVPLPTSSRAGSGGGTSGAVAELEGSGGA